MTIEMMVYANEGMITNYEAVINKFHQSQSAIRVKLENVIGEDWSDYEFNLRTRILSGNAPDIVDVSVVYHDALISDGLLLDLIPYIEKSDIDMTKYFKNQFDEYRVGSGLYGIPSGALLMAVYINIDLFDEAGLTLPSYDWLDTWSWDEFTYAARKIALIASEDRNIYGMTMDWSVGWLLPFIMSNEGSFLIDAELDSDQIDPASMEVFTMLKQLMFDEEISPDMMDLIRLEPYQYFMDGEVGIWVDGNWWMDAVQDTVDFNWTAVPLPILKTPATGMYVDAWAVAAESDSPDEAFEVLKFFLDVEQQKSGITKGIPVLKSSAFEIYNDRFPNYTKEETNVWFDGINFGLTPAYHQGWNDFNNKATDLLRKYSFNELKSDDFFSQLLSSYKESR